MQHSNQNLINLSSIYHLVVDHVTSNLPLSYINLNYYIAVPGSIKFADPLYNVLSIIDALVGASIFWTICLEQLKLMSTQLVANKPNWAGFYQGKFVSH